MAMHTISCFTAGATRGNPGPAAVGVQIVYHDGVVASEVAYPIGNSTPALAAFQAVLVGLETLQADLGVVTRSTPITVYLADEEVKAALAAEAPVTAPALVPLFMAVHNLRVGYFPLLTFVYEPTAKVSAASALAASALDGVL